MPSNLSSAVKAIAALKPLVVAGAIVAGVALTAGSQFTSVDAASAQQRMRVYAMHTATENDLDSLKSLRHGLHAIAELDVATMEPSVAATTLRSMAEQTVKDCVFLTGMTETNARALSVLRTDGVAAMDRDVDDRANAQASFDRSVAMNLDASQVDELDRTGAEWTKAVVSGNFAKDALTRIATARTALPSAMQAVARNALAKLGDGGREGVAGTVAERLENSVVTKREALASIVKMVDEAYLAGGDATDDTMSQITSGAEAAREDIPSADRVSLHAVAAHYSTHPDQAHDAKRAVTAGVQADILDASLSRVVGILDRGGDDSLPLAKSAAVTAIAQSDAIGRSIEMHADAAMDMPSP